MIEKKKQKDEFSLKLNLKFMIALTFTDEQRNENIL